LNTNVILAANKIFVEYYVSCIYYIIFLHQMQIRKNGFTFFSVSLWACVFYALPFLVQSSTAIAIVVVVVVLPRVVCIFKIIAKHISMFEYLHTKCTHSYAQTERIRNKGGPSNVCYAKDFISAPTLFHFGINNWCLICAWHLTFSFSSALNSAWGILKH